MKSYLNKGGSADRVISGWPLITIAANYQRKDILMLLLNHGADINYKNINGDTALILAAYNMYHDELLVLLSHGADTEIRGLDGRSALMWSVVKGDERSVRTLIKYGANINSNSLPANELDQKSPLMLAVSSDNLEMTSLLLSEGADPNYTNLRCESALTYSVQLKSIKIKSLLVQNGASEKNSEKCSHKQNVVTYSIVLLIFTIAIFGVIRSSKREFNSTLRIIAVILNSIIAALIVMLLPPSYMKFNLFDISEVTVIVLFICNSFVVSGFSNKLTCKILLSINILLLIMLIGFMFKFSAEEFAMAGFIGFICLMTFVFTSRIIYLDINNRS